MVGVFLLGMVGYPLLELLYRGRTHYSMSLAGGISALWINCIRKLKTSIFVRGFLGGAGITAIEYICGQVWNRKHRIWDYSRAPMNCKGQICLGYSLLWCGLSICLIGALNQIEHMKKDG